MSDINNAVGYNNKPVILHSLWARARITTPKKGFFGIDLIYTKAHLVAEPTNPYDETAIAVYVHDNNGDDHRIGYIPKNSELKPYLTGDDNMDMIVMDYHSQGMNTSYVLRGFE